MLFNLNYLRVDSDFELNSSKKKSKNNSKKTGAKNVGKENLKDAKGKFISKRDVATDDGSSDSASEDVKDAETSKKAKNIINAAKKSKRNNTDPNTSGHKADYSDETDDEKELQTTKNKTRKTTPMVKPEARVKLPTDRVAKGKNPTKTKVSAMSSDSDASAPQSKETRSKGKDPKESSTLDSPSKKQYTRSSTKKDEPEKVINKGKSKENNKPVQRMSQRMINKYKEVSEEDLEKNGKDKVSKTISLKKGDKECLSSDSEEQTTQKTEPKTEEMAQMREMFKKYISKLDMKEGELNNDNFKKKKNYDSSDSEDLPKTNKLKQETESESEMEKKTPKKSTKKSKTELLEEKVQKIKKQKNILDDKKGKNRKSDDKEMKEKEETIVSSSSQEPITRSVAIQASRIEIPPEESQELVQKTERVAELEKELQVQLNANKLLEVELNKTRVILDRIRSDHEDEISELNSKHVMNVSEIKKKQWVSRHT